MGFVIDLHLHTKRYSKCSRIDPARLIDRAVKAGLDGVVITEHHHQWDQAELDALRAESRSPAFLVLAAFEYTSLQGDLLIYGLDPHQVDLFKPGWPPERAAELADRLGGVCIAAHPTRAGLAFDERLATLRLAAMEVSSVNMKVHEQRLAWTLSSSLGIPPVAGSDAHDLAHLGRYATEFDDLITSSADLQSALRRGRFLVAPGAKRKDDQ